MVYVKCLLCAKAFEEGTGIKVHFARKHGMTEILSHTKSLDPNLPDDAAMIKETKARKAKKGQSRKKSHQKKTRKRKPGPKPGPRRRKQRVLKQGKRAVTTPQATEIVIPLMLRIPIVMGEVVIESVKM